MLISKKKPNSHLELSIGKRDVSNICRTGKEQKITSLLIDFLSEEAIRNIGKQNDKNIGPCHDLYR